MPRVRKSVPAIERFPAQPRADGYYQKRILGHLYYFGVKGGTREQALAEYNRMRVALYQGRKPAPRADDNRLTVKQLANRFLDEKLADVEADRMTDDWYKQHRAALKRFGKRVGMDRTIASLTPDDFSDYGRYLGGKLGDHAYNRERSSIMAMLNHAVASDWIEKPVKIGPGFPKVGSAVLREKRKSKLLKPAIVMHLLSEAGPQLRAMILLGVNGGFGGTDCGKLLKSQIEGGWIRSRRSKTGIRRDTPLWDQTINALAPLLARRPNDPLVFRTKYGNAWTDSSVAHEFQKLRDRMELKGVVFSDLRHTYATYASGAGDHDAKERIMGHRLRGLDDVYVATVFEDRLRKVVEHVREHLFVPSVG